MAYLFSTCGAVTRVQRARLNARTVEALLLWMQFNSEAALY